MRHESESFFIPIVFIALTFSVNAQQIEDPDMLFRMARQAAFEQNDYTSAIKYSKQALALAPNYLDVQEFLGKVYFWNSQPNLAEPLLTDVIEKEPNREYVRITLIDIKLERNQNKKALDLTENGLNYDPSNVFFLLRKAAALNGLNRNTEAVEVYNQVLRIEPNNSMASNAPRELNEYVYPWSASLSTTH